MSNTSSTSLHGVYTAILNGLHERGDGGFLYLKDNNAMYLFPDEVKNQNDLRDSMRSMLQDDSSKNVFYVAEERNGEIHLLAYPRTVVLEEARKATERGSGGEK